MKRTSITLLLLIQPLLLIALAVSDNWFYAWHFSDNHFVYDALISSASFLLFCIGFARGVQRQSVREALLVLFLVFFVGYRWLAWGVAQPRPSLTQRPLTNGYQLQLVNFDPGAMGTAHVELWLVKSYPGLRKRVAKLADYNNIRTAEISLSGTDIRLEMLDFSDQSRVERVALPADLPPLLNR